MCGRYRLSRRKELLAEYFHADLSDFDSWEPRYNIAPTQPIPVVRQHPKEPKRVLSLMRMGAYSIVGKGHVRRYEHDQREIGDGGDEARIP